MRYRRLRALLILTVGNSALLIVIASALVVHVVDVEERAEEYMAPRAERVASFFVQRASSSALCVPFTVQECVLACGAGKDHMVAGLQACGLDNRWEACRPLVPNEITYDGGIASYCRDSVDNDCDGKIDYEDSDCAPEGKPITL